MNSIRIIWVIASFLAVIGISEEAEAGLVEISINDSEDLLISEDEDVFQEGINLTLYIRLKGDLRSESSDKYVESIAIKVHFRNDEDIRDYLQGYPEYQPLCDECEDPGYDEYASKFRADDEWFKGYNGTLDFQVTMKNNSGDIVWDSSVTVLIVKNDYTGTGNESTGAGNVESPLPSLSLILTTVSIGLIARYRRK